MKKIKKVGVLGSGLMGSGIAEVAARSGYDTVVREVTSELLTRGSARIRGSMDKAVERGKMEAAARDQAVSVSPGPSTTSRPWPTATSSWKRSSRTWTRRRRPSALSTRR